MEKIMDRPNHTMHILENTAQDLPQAESTQAPPQDETTAPLPLLTRSMPDYHSTGKTDFQTDPVLGCRTIALSSRRSQDWT